ncbi:MAG: glycosyltransferase family 2 protein [Planctomycetia bacterium]|nr:glycosyltransferase family 2 protein [Planctomycetia bacterium]
MLSIIVPVYNRENLVGETIESIRSQNRTDWECLLIDDQSSDNSFEKMKDQIRGEDRFRLFRRPFDYPRGVSSCRNFGFEQSCGDYIFFCDSDDLLDSTFWNAYAPHFEEDPQLDYLNIRFARFCDSPSRLYRKSPVKPTDLSILEAIAGRKLSHATASFIWKKEYLASQAFLWDTELICGEDREFSFRMLSGNSVGKAISEPVLYYYRKHETETRTTVRKSRGWQKQMLGMEYRIVSSMIRQAKEKEESSKLIDFLGDNLRRLMKKSSRWGNHEFLLRFFELSKELSLSPYAKRKLDRSFYVSQCFLPFWSFWTQSGK